MSIIIFIIILGALVFVHELGHFLIAKWAKIRVDEFALGFPPKIFSFKPKKGKTVTASEFSKMRMEMMQQQFQNGGIRFGG